MQIQINQYLNDIANGDDKAMSLLFEAVSARLFGIQLRILKNRELAEDALQETFLKIWNSANTYSAQQGSPMTWLNTLARNHALDMLRRSNTRAAVNVKIPDLDPDAWSSTGREYSDSVEQFEGLLQCLQQLNPETQACLVSVYCDGYTQEEISQSLQRPAGTVKSWIRRGLASLRECLDDGD